MGGTTTRELRNFIHGERVTSEGAKTAPLVDPSTGEVFAEAPVSSPEDVQRALLSAKDAFGEWKRSTPSERSLALFRVADAIEARAEELVRVECENTGKPFAVTMAEEIPVMVDQIRFFAGAARLLEGRAAAEYMAGHTSYVRREPVGVCAAVTPWNYPMMMAVWKWAPALAAGNTMVLKPSDTTPVSTLLLAEILAEHLPPGVLNVVCGDRDTGRALVANKIPAMVSITGSVRAGMEVATSAAGDLKRVHLELGGKAPVIVFDDADVGPRQRASRWRATSTLGRTARQQLGCWFRPAPTAISLMRWLSKRVPQRSAPTAKTTPVKMLPTGLSITLPSSSAFVDSCSMRRATWRCLREANRSATVGTALRQRWSLASAKTTKWCSRRSSGR